VSLHVVEAAGSNHVTMKCTSLQQSTQDKSLRRLAKIVPDDRK